MKNLILLSLLITSSTALADLAEEVRCREIGFSKAAEKQNAKRFASFIDADARFVSSTVTRGPDAVAEAWTVFFTSDSPTIKWRPQIVEVLEDGKLALSRGPYRVISKDEDGNETEHWGTFNSVWRLQADGGWKVVFDAGSAAAQPPSEEVQALLDQKDNCRR